MSAAWLCIALGSCLRLTWSLDFEWKSDERWMFGEAQRIAQGVDPWPWVGMPSGIGVQNPGASVWAFAALAHLAHDPVSMTRAVALLNVLSLWGFAWWVRATWAPRDRAVGLWGVALFALSPLPILFARKIWAQDLLPALLVPWLWAHAKRERVPAAFAWGACGALLGQVHMSGFFAAAALALATLLVERRQGGTRWRAWLAGSACGALPLLPWLAFLVSPKRGHISHGRHWSLRFVWEAFANAWGVGLRYSLGPDFDAFMRGPRVLGTDTRLVAAAHAGLLMLALASAIVMWRARGQIALSAPLRIHFLTVAIAGLMLHATGVKVYAHYLIVFSPLLHVAAAWMLSRRERWLWAACALQLFVSASFLWFIHDHGGAPRGDFGISYRQQLESTP